MVGTDETTELWRFYNIWWAFNRSKNVAELFNFENKIDAYLYFWENRSLVFEISREHIFQNFDIFAIFYSIFTFEKFDIDEAMT